jgi:hypothetical protein
MIPTGEAGYMKPKNATQQEPLPLNFQGQDRAIFGNVFDFFGTLGHRRACSSGSKAVFFEKDQY